MGHLLFQSDAKSVSDVMDDAFGDFVRLVVDDAFVVEGAEKTRQNDFGLHLSEHLFDNDSDYKPIAGS